MTKDASTTPHFSSESNPQEVAIAVIVRPSAETNGLEHEILAAWREKGAIRGGNWELPGGKVEAGESISAAAARETLEEMGLEIETGDLLTSSEDLDHSLPRENHVKVHAVMASTIMNFEVGEVVVVPKGLVMGSPVMLRGKGTSEWGLEVEIGPNNFSFKARLKRHIGTYAWTGRIPGSFNPRLTNLKSFRSVESGSF